MSNTILGMNNYSNFFSSPFNSTQVSPLANLIYGANASRIYSQTVAKSLSSNVSSFMTSLSKSAYDLKAATKPLVSSGPESSFNKKTIISSDSNAVTGTAASNADSKAYTINVSKLAISQVNTGTALKTNDKSTLSSGLNSVALKVGTTSKNISFTIDEKDTNQSGLSKMASAINFAKAGVTANVFTDTKTGTSSLKITSDKTGTGNEISLTDINGNAAFVSGANTVSSQAQDAEYKLDGKQYTSKSNTISIDYDKVQLTLNKAESKDIRLSVGRDSNAVTEDIQNLVKNYNNLISTANSNSSAFSGAEKLKSDLEGIIRSDKASLSSMGINQNGDGTLAVDKKKLSDAVINNFSNIKDVFGGYNGVSQKLYSKAIQVQTSPQQYMKQPNFGNGFNFNTNNPFQSNSFRPGQNIFSGMVVDTFL